MRFVYGRYQISQHPKVEARLVEELRSLDLLATREQPRVRDLTYDDLAELTYLSCVVKARWQTTNTLYLNPEPEWSQPILVPTVIVCKNALLSTSGAHKNIVCFVMPARQTWLFNSTVHMHHTQVRVTSGCTDMIAVGTPQRNKRWVMQGFMEISSPHGPSAAHWTRAAAPIEGIHAAETRGRRGHRPCRAGEGCQPGGRQVPHPGEHGPVGGVARVPQQRPQLGPGCAQLHASGCSDPQPNCSSKPSQYPSPSLRSNAKNVPN